jgi:hypothetical protein
VSRWSTAARWDIAGHLNKADALAQLVLDHPEARKVHRLVQMADHDATTAQRRLVTWDHHAAARAAQRSFKHLDVLRPVT